MTSVLCSLLVVLYISLIARDDCSVTDVWSPCPVRSLHHACSERRSPLKAGAAALEERWSTSTIRPFSTSGWPSCASAAAVSLTVMSRSRRWPRRSSGARRCRPRRGAGSVGRPAPPDGRRCRGRGAAPDDRAGARPRVGARSGERPPAGALRGCPRAGAGLARPGRGPAGRRADLDPGGRRFRDRSHRGPGRRAVPVPRRRGLARAGRDGGADRPAAVTRLLDNRPV